jgi:branched-subunit amino acid aminotransferase/4-amino-4-deoxychorismate lyase
VLVTPPLTGTILPGITRDSILTLARQWGDCEVQERPVTIAEVREVSGSQHSFACLCRVMKWSAVCGSWSGRVTVEGMVQKYVASFSSGA